MTSDADAPDGVALREYLDQRLADLAARFEVDLRGREQALILAERNLSTRLEHLNEFRAQMQEERGHFVTRDMFDGAITNLTGRMNRVGEMTEERLRALEHTTTDHAVRFWAVGAATTFTAVLASILIRVVGK